MCFIRWTVDDINQSHHVSKYYSLFYTGNCIGLDLKILYSFVGESKWYEEG